MKVSELAAGLAQVTSQVNKAKDEITAKIAALEAELRNLDVDLPPGAETALADLKAAVQSVDDINPDAPTV